MSDTTPDTTAQCVGCWRHKSGALYIDPACPVHGTTPDTTALRERVLAWMTITRGKQPDKWVPRSWVLDLIDDLAAARREPCPDCRESASGVCTMHNGSFSLGARRDPEPVASADPMQTFLDADPKWTPQEQAEWKASHPEPVASADAARVLDGNDAALKLAVGKTPGQADWLRPVTITDVLAAIRGTASPLDRVTLAEAIISAGLVRRGSFAYDWADAILARLRATEGTDV